ncbi:hypothetical protein BEV13_03475 [Rickettsiella grylli]|uniref:hypothetical protein n=1 Tax=Rickettsiella grylli TaxID=59196 RepID=UPI0008FD092B|nr:hypothetical protein [Rickettsiella grylli]OJA00487.1 hypothetical protein BEV13_03475 [Rickettsiella grylli]
MSFISALINFSKNGFFELTNSHLILDNIHVLDRRIQYLKKYEPEINFYRIHLNNINLISDVLPHETYQPQPVLNGAITEYNSRDWSDKLTDVALVQMMQMNGFMAPLRIRDEGESPERQLTTLKNALFSVLTQSNSWDSIELENVFFYHGRQIYYEVTDDFYKALLNALVENDALRELSLNPFSLTKHRKDLIHFLTKHSSLEALHLAINDGSEQDWITLGHSVTLHPKLKILNLSNSVLDIHAYSALSNVLDRNYRVDILLPDRPAAPHLWDVYERLRERSLKSCVERFKEDYLTQDQLLSIALRALDFLHVLRFDHSEESLLLEQQFDFLVDNEGYRAITSDQKEAWAEKIKVLPLVYQNHIDYLKHEASFVQLQMSEVVADGSKTIGYALLEKALETQNPKALKTLLNANINLFEFPNTMDDPFLVRVLQSKGDLKKMVVDYIRSDQRLLERASEYLVTYPDLRNLFKEFKDHLDDYGAHLKKDNPTVLFLIAKKILHTWRSIVELENPSEKRGKECAAIYLVLDKSLQIMEKTSEDTYNAFDAVHTLMIQMREDSTKALRDFFNTSFLHEKILELIHKFEIQLLLRKKEIKEKEINQLKERSVSREKFLTLEAKNMDLETKNTDLKAENAEIKAQLKAFMKKMQRAADDADPEAAGEAACSRSGFFQS